jgi:hypothetical protein
MSAEQLALDCEPDWNDDDWLDEIPDGPAYPDLRGQGLTALQLHTMTDVSLTGRYL